MTKPWNVHSTSTLDTRNMVYWDTEKLIIEGNQEILGNGHLSEKQTEDSVAVPIFNNSKHMMFI